MRKILVALVLLACSSLPLMAQDYSKVEIFGGYQYTHFGSSTSPIATANGFDGNFTYFFNKSVGVEGDFTGAYQKTSVEVTESNGSVLAADVPLHWYSYAGGPVFSFPAGNKIRPFAHALFGGVHETTSASAEGATVSVSINGFTTLIGGGVDLKLSKHIALRLVQADWVLYRVSAFGMTATSHDTIKIASGVAFYF
jgi:hypothetical protein